MEKYRNEIELLALVKQGDEAAFEELYERYHKLVYFVAYKACKSDADAQDVVQETFLQIQHSIHNLQNPQYFRLWMYRIIDSKCKKLFRKNKYDLTDLERDAIQNEFHEEQREFIPMKQMRHASDRAMLTAYIDELPYGQRMVILLYYMEQFSVNEIADICGVPVGTVKSRLSSARAALKQKISEYEANSGIKLDFHDTCSMLGTVLLAGCANGKAFFQPMRVPSLHAGKTSVFHSGAQALTSHMVIAGLSIAVAGTGAFALYHQGMKQQTQSIAEQSFAQSDYPFPETAFFNQEIRSSREAYYHLKMNVSIQDMEHMDAYTEAEVERLLIALKSANSQYYQTLMEEEWGNTYQKLKK